MTDFQKRVDRAIAEAIVSFGPQTKLRDAIEYALRNEGKRVRPSIVYMVAEALGKNLEVTHSALAIEFFHTASLIADDLPCMDNDDMRRNRPTLHNAFDEATALLASYALIAAGYDRIRQNGLLLEKLGVAGGSKICLLALENATYNTGISGITGGQHFDLFTQKGVEETLQEIIHKKTGTLFEISFVFGWLFGGGALTELERVKKVARHFGIAFQISDDFLDFERDILEGRFNFPASVGVERAAQAFSYELAQLKELLKKLELDSADLLVLVEHLEKHVIPILE